MHDPLDANGLLVLDDPKQDEVPTMNRDAKPGRDVIARRMQPSVINEAAALGFQRVNERYCPRGIVAGDVFGDLQEIEFRPGRNEQAF